MIFHDRTSAGVQLARELESYRRENPVVIALPRGGVPVAVEVAKHLGAPLDVLIVRKLGAPENPEYAIGAIAEGGEPWLRQAAVRQLGISSEALQRVISSQQEEIRRRIAAYRQGRPAAEVRGRTVLLVDDGVATGATMMAAVHALREKGAARIIVAVPAASSNSADSLRREADAVVAIIERDDFYAIGQWYEDFAQVSDEVVTRLLADSGRRGTSSPGEREIFIASGAIRLPGNLTEPAHCRAWVVFAHGSGSSRKSPRNAKVARGLNEVGLGTLLFDLLMAQEEEDRRNVFDVRLLTERLLLAIHWLRDNAAPLPIGCFGASTGAAAALCAAAEPKAAPYAVVSRGGRPDLAGDCLPRVKAPVLLIVGGNDETVLELNQAAARQLHHAKLAIVPGAGHLFEEPGALDHVIQLAGRWFTTHLPQG